MGEARKAVNGWVVIKAVDTANRRIGGFFSTRFTDREGEEFDPSAFAASIAPGGNYYNNPVLLYNHDSNRLIGRADVSTLGYDEVGAYGEFLVSEDDAWGQMERGELRGFSWFGFINPAKTQIRMDESGKQIPVHYEVDLVEVTATPIPCNPAALFEVRSKALKLGQAQDNEFPAGQAEQPAEDVQMSELEKRKAVYLGTYAESDMAVAALYSLQDRLMWKVADVLDSSATPAEERVEMVKAMFGEFAELGLRTIEAIMGGQATETPQAASKSIRSLWKQPEPEKPAEPEKQPAQKSAPEGADEGDDMKAEEVQALVASEVEKAVSPLATALKSISEKLGAGTPAANPEPAATPESTGDAAAQKGLVLDDAGIDKLAAALANRVATPGATKGLQADGAEKPEVKKAANIKGLVERAKSTPYTNGHGWRSMLEDAIALQETGGAQTYAELGAGEE
ncbi:MAG: HK97 family phage prohead protease [Armatimonadota bacterium]